MLGVVLGKLCLHLCVSILFPLEKFATQVLVCLPIGWVEVLEVQRMLDEQVLVYLSVGLKCWKFCACWPHRYLCACLLVGLKCWKFCGC